MIAVFHAYSRVNSGDGLLVDLTYQLLGEVGIAADDIVLIAHDHRSFSDLSNVVPVLGTSRDDGGHPHRNRLAQLSPRALRRSRSMLKEIAEEASLCVGVGGAYLRGSTPAEAAKSASIHGAQLRVVANAGKGFYLPQSVGPFRFWPSTTPRRDLANLVRLYVRDDRSLAEAPNAVRAPDLAILQLSRAFHGLRPGHRPGPVVVVARELTRPSTYVKDVGELLTLLPSPILAVQSEGRGNNDRTFLARLGHSNLPTLRSVLASEDPGVVIAVRLHAALEALIAGWSVILLGYERKSWGAAQDLDLREFLHSARCFSPSTVAAQAMNLQGDPTAQTEAIARSMARIADARAELLRDIAQALTMPASAPQRAET